MTQPKTLRLRDNLAVLRLMVAQLPLEYQPPFLELLAELEADCRQLADLRSEMESLIQDVSLETAATQFDLYATKVELEQARDQKGDS